MAKQIAQTGTKPSAWIVNPNDKGRKSIKSGKCFLKNNSSFEIELFNPLTVSVLADIKLNGQSVSKTGLLVKPGQRVYLDCFIDDKKKFVFSTYEIDGDLESLNATQKNGVLEVFFYKEDVITLNNWQRRFDRIIVEKHYPYNPYPWYNPYPVYCGNGITFKSTGSLTTGDANTTTTYLSNSINCSYISQVDLPNLNVAGSLSTNSIETGRVEKGESSKQQFTEVNMEFEKHYIASNIIQILPESRKPAEVKDVKKVKQESNDVIELIKKLADLHSAGILTDEEFSSKKAELLSKI